MQAPDAVDAMTGVVEALERLGVAYYVGGSMASSVHGIGRTTRDVDLVADLAMEHAALLVKSLEATYYVSLPAVFEAITRKSCFNLIHTQTAFKVDVFVVKDREYDRTAMRRVRKESFDNRQEFFVASPEDIVLAKLEWFRLGDEVSETQWRDVVNVLHVQGNSLEQSYLDRWATELGVADLLERAKEEVRALDSEQGQT